MFYPDYQSVSYNKVRARFERTWGTELNPDTGLTVTEVIKSILDGGVRGMYMLGENPFLSDPNINKVRKALSKLDFLVVGHLPHRDRGVRRRGPAGLVVALEKDGTYTNTDRRVQIGRKVFDPPGDARVDWEIVQDIARRVGLDWNYSSPSEIFDEMVPLMPDYANLTHDNLGRTASCTRSRTRTTATAPWCCSTSGSTPPTGSPTWMPAEWLPARSCPARSSRSC